MPIIAGIDEAGYGPLFGPLVITSTVFDIPSCKENDLWDLLKDTVAKEKAGNRDKIIVTDSKKLYSAATGLHRLEESVLTFLHCINENVKSFKDLLDYFTDIKHSSLDIYPWYCKKDITIPVSPRTNPTDKFANQLKEAFSSSSSSLLNISILPVPVHDFNVEIKKIGNKASLLFNKCGDLLIEIWEKFGEEEPKVYIDKLGGRNHYLPLLNQVFGNHSIKVNKEHHTESVYEIRGCSKRMHVSFVMGSETKYFPSALASMCSKYTREVFIKLFNLFWLEKYPDIKPTAGYYLDAKRFLGQIKNIKKELKIRDELMIRVK